MALHNNMRDQLFSFLFCLQFNFYLHNDTALKDFLDEGNFILIKIYINVSYIKNI